MECPPGLNNNFVNLNNTDKKEFDNVKHNQATKKPKMLRFVRPKIKLMNHNWCPIPPQQSPAKDVSNIEIQKNREIMNIENEQENKDILGMEGNEEFIEVTVDSGAFDSVMNRRLARQCRLRPSEGSRNGVKYVAAAGAVIENEGEKHVRVEIEKGHVCNMIIQITEVSKALLSVGKICDAGYEVVFNTDGGKIIHRESGHVVNFRRIDGVYRLKLKVVGEAASGFQRPGK